MTAKFFRKVLNSRELKEQTKRFNGEMEFEVIARVDLNENDYKEFENNLLKDQEFIAEHTKKTGVKNRKAQCILVSKVGDDKQAIAVNSEGYNYARYAALVTL